MQVAVLLSSGPKRSWQSSTARNGDGTLRRPVKVAAVGREKFKPALGLEPSMAMPRLLGLSAFGVAVHMTVQAVPKGRVITYRDVARSIGRPGAARAVGTVMAGNPDIQATPCHRVVRGDGTVGWYAGGPAGVSEKIRKLRAEGVRVGSDGRIERFDVVRWSPTG